MKKLIFLLLMPLVSGLNAAAQQIPNAAPSSSITQELGISELTVRYRRPAVAGKQILTGNNPVIPAHKIWNTTISITANTYFIIENQYLNPGKYTLYAIPESEQWTLIFKKVNEQTDDQDEIFRTIVKSDTIPFTETLEASFKNITDNTALFTISWDTFSIPIKIAVPTNSLVLNSYQQALLKRPGHSRTLQYGTWFLLTRGFELPLALSWIERDIHLKEGYFNNWLKAQLLRKLNRNDEAIKTARRALDLALVSSDLDYGTYVPRIRTALEFWQKTPDLTLLVADQ